MKNEIHVLGVQHSGGKDKQVRHAVVIVGLRSFIRANHSVYDSFCQLIFQRRHAFPVGEAAPASNAIVNLHGSGMVTFLGDGCARNLAFGVNVGLQQAARIKEA